MTLGTHDLLEIEVYMGPRTHTSNAHLPEDRELSDGKFHE